MVQANKLIIIFLNEKNKGYNSRTFAKILTIEIVDFIKYASKLKEFNITH